MRANAPNTSQWAFLECHTLIDRYKVGIIWSPGHMGIEGNEMADELADAGANEGRMDNDRSAEPTISGIGTTARALANVIMTSDWESKIYRTFGVIPQVGTRICHSRTLRAPPPPHVAPPALSRPNGTWRLCAQYHRRFGHSDAELNCLCGYEKTPEHLVFCEISQRKFHAWPAKPDRPPSRPEEGRKYLNAIMAHPELFENFLTVTQHFTLNARASQTRDRTSSGGPQ
ncbi:hypothetical protein DID88_010019 [Monilinia fructigena]|uniref:RNase H type-1 domain-containing protein n=1 Tax=Monilinia fructigena TaxID=38457 RepID=A0A395IKN3_9HELO|nr:hypothetical protein DID88_010019 [Monilinia fructigena]